MARKGDAPQEHVIVRAGVEDACVTCGGSFSADEHALGEAYVAASGKLERSLRYARSERSRESYYDDDRGGASWTPNADFALRFHHLRCAVEHQPYKLRGALKASADPIPAREELLDQIDEFLRPGDAAQKNPATRAQYEAHVARIQETLDDADFLVFGDWLQSVGDPRGELVHVQHALETATGEQRVVLLDAEKRLLPSLSTAVAGFVLEWRRGFVRKCRASHKWDVAPPVKIEHPSLVFLRAEDYLPFEKITEHVPLEKPKADGPRLDGEWKVRHTRKPEWGEGRVVGGDEDSGLEVEFEAAGKKLVKNVELLEDVS
ncbi:MAG: DUF3553 domain-containing protein [Kofleriaceae bacterium]